MDRIKRYIDSDNLSDSNGSNASSSEYYNSDSETISNENNTSDDITESESDSEDEISNLKLNSIWAIWYHHQKNNWKLDSYKNIFTFKNIKDFWNFNNNLNLIGGINTQHYFMMRNDITPIWEDINNKNGGCWSIKIPVEKSYELWIKLSMYIIGESLTDDRYLVNGISICAKNTTTSVVKIWINDNNKSSIKNLPTDILNEYGFNIIYKSHIPEY
tara:strand:+ start:827 stop:1474 length:648 start_codon:yes stop_codon:yes gene_type:complete